MKKLTGLLMLFALGSLPVAAGQWTGYLSDEKCASSNAKAKAAAEWIKPEAFESCVKKCVKDGSAVVFVTEDNQILHMDAASIEKVMPHIGHKVSIAGTIDGHMLKVDKVTD